MGASALANWWSAQGVLKITLEGLKMMFHASIAAAEPARVAGVVAELWGGKKFPFYPGVGNSWMVIAGDARGTALEVYPHGHLLRPNPVRGAELQTHLPRESSTHIAIGTILSRQQVLAIGEREGWATFEKHRPGGGGFDVIELWAENAVMIEVLVAEKQDEYAHSSSIESWEKYVAEKSRA
jgi:hypothetical protein